MVGPGQIHSVTSSSAENFILNGGTLTPTDVTLTGQIELQSTSRILRPQNDLVEGSRSQLFENRPDQQSWTDLSSELLS